MWSGKRKGTREIRYAGGNSHSNNINAGCSCGGTIMEKIKASPSSYGGSNYREFTELGLAHDRPKTVQITILITQSVQRGKRTCSMAIFALTTKLVPVVKENVTSPLKLYLATNRKKKDNIVYHRTIVRSSKHRF